MAAAMSFKNMIGVTWNEGAQLLDQGTVYGFCRLCDCKFSVAYTLLSERIVPLTHDGRKVTITYAIGARIPFAEVLAHAYCAPHTFYDPVDGQIMAGVDTLRDDLCPQDVANCVVFMHDEKGAVLYLAKPGSLGPHGSVGGTPAADLKRWATVCALSAAAIQPAPSFEALLRLCEEKWKRADQKTEWASASSTSALPINTATTGSKANA